MSVRDRLREGLTIPAHPLALTSERKFDERRQRALTRYYVAAGAGGLAFGVHTTQFAIRDPKIGLLKPVLQLGIEEIGPQPIIKIAGVCGRRRQALEEAELARLVGYDAALLSLAALPEATVDDLIDHASSVASVIPVIGFYLQPAVGGRVLSYEFWRRFAEIPNIVAIKIAPFSRYQTLEVVRAVVESGRADEIALYTGNDDNIISDLLTKFNFGTQSIRIVGGLLGHWAVWTRSAVSLLKLMKQGLAMNVPEAETLYYLRGSATVSDLLTLAQQVTDMNAAIFDPSHQFHGCIPGIHEVLRRQGLLAGRWCLDPKEELSPGQNQEIDRVCRAYPGLVAQDEALIKEHLDDWLR